MAENTAPTPVLLDLGSDHALELVPFPGQAGRLAGYVLRHPSALDGSPCAAFLATSGLHSAASTQLVAVVSDEGAPLTLAPAPLVCAVCGDSGTVSSGVWVSNPAAVGFPIAQLAAAAKPAQADKA